MRVTVDADRCTSSGQCVVLAPGVFDQRDEDGTVVLLTDAPAPELHGAVRRSVAACPASAIAIGG